MSHDSKRQLTNEDIDAIVNSLDELRYDTKYEPLTSDVQHADEEIGGHADERWLVSYADLMTLLFGLFALLYGMSIKKGGDISSQMKAVSAASFSSSNHSVEIKQSTWTDEQVQIIVAEKTKLENRIKELLDYIELLKQYKSKVDNQAVEVIKRSAASIDEEKQKLEDKIEAQEDQIDELTDEIVDEKISLENIEKQMTLSKQRISELEKQVISSSQLKPEVPIVHNFMMIVSKWSTEKHDIDMIIKDPEGSIYNFKKRKYNGKEGEFVMDSRYGPGVEMWQSQKIIPGQYEVRIKMYSSNGNNSDAKVELEILTNAGRFSMLEFLMNKENKEVVKLINVTDKGIAEFKSAEGK